MLSRLASSIVSRCALAGTLAFTAFTGLGCVDEQDHLVISRAVWFDARDNCVLSNNTASPLNMVADVSFDTQIGMGFVVENNQIQNAGSNTGIDDSVVQLLSADVTFTYSGGAAPTGFNSPIPQTSIAGGESDVVLVDIPTSITEQLRGTLSEGVIEVLEMTVVIKARRTDSISDDGPLGKIETQEFTYPLEICLGCLRYCGAPSDSEECVGVCPSTTGFSGTCGYAQGLPVSAPGCEPDA
ncbi:hypothetical protein PPSIR1_35472 [Plesiocystis pacifica SIR-1]|uniref:Lipoprotein n=1 Tax=Plesiocystis pacifica SIR-1 TaxID=391625 RepID=A6GHC1_9BACT|nr:hypothetical protein [Plesiocystis pacifica]EDM74736.1 hypothetical protein PPSIR1_35472 [Plesiocystis pacifica SIR-1]